MQLIRLMRPVHWIKNVFVFAALIFSRKLAAEPAEAFQAISRSIGAFVAFSLAASAIYILNDIVDRNTDRVHPQKRNRPLASGQVGPRAAAVLAFGCGLASLVVGLLLTTQLIWVLVAYMLLVASYSLVLKRVMILDCVAISIGFCLRAVAGAVAISVRISPWLIICTFALCLFMAFGKRRGEIARLQADSEAFRQTLAEYTPELLAHMLNVTSVLAVVCFLLYAMDDRTLRLFGTDRLIYTCPAVLYCVFRFSALIEKGTYTGPVEIVLRDRPFQIGMIIWLVLTGWVIYGADLGLSAASAAGQ